MKYNLKDKEQRRNFVKRCNSLLSNERSCVEVVDESDRTINQNSYIHVLCRVLANETGTTEAYAKQVYFKELANPSLFVRVTKDPLTGKMVKTIRSTCDLTISEMSTAIRTFIEWAATQGYVLPEATFDDKGIASFKSVTDKTMFNQANIATSREVFY